jgi:uncharacterized protein (TIGR04255 family)
METALDRSGSLADFRRPPVVETSLGFYFPPMSAWSFIHFGALWESFKDKYPKPEYKPPLQVPVQPQQLIMEILTDIGKFPLRMCLVDASNTQLVQVQNGCFLHNWRKTTETPLYQHYENLRPVFLQDWELFCQFLDRNSIPHPNVSRCEMTYFNHLVRGEDWQSISDFQDMFPTWHVGSGDVPFSKIEMMNFSVWYEHSEGKVQITVSPGVRQDDGKEVIQLTVTGSATPTGSTGDELFECLDSSHRSAVLGFVKFTSEQLQKRWERTR